TAYNEKQRGVEYRQKYRVRIYNKSDDMIKLERKEKYGEFISKQSFVITKDEFYNLVSGNDIGFLLKSDSEMPPQMYWAIRTKLLKPAVIVDYRRDVLICDDGNVRITFDRELQAGIDTPDIFSNVHVIDALNPDTMVLEVKYDDFLPSYIKKALQIKSQSREAVSKYVYCREMQFLHNPAARLNFII
ncbi:MAG: polyphosphate polymerase domain-containing protein, partial [Clostridia bacterium]